MLTNRVLKADIPKVRVFPPARLALYKIGIDLVAEGIESAKPAPAGLIQILSPRYEQTWRTSIFT